MLAIDAAARDAIRRKKRLAKLASRERLSRSAQKWWRNSFLVEKRQTVSARIITRSPWLAQSACRNQLLSQDPADEGAERSLDSAKFHAALGLAQLGDAAGFHWLIAHSADVQLAVSNALPAQGSNANRDTYYTAALQQLSGNKDLRTKEEWEVWWNRSTRVFPKNRINLVDP